MGGQDQEDKSKDGERESPHLEDAETTTNATCPGTRALRGLDAIITSGRGRGGHGPRNGGRDALVQPEG